MAVVFLIDASDESVVKMVSNSAHVLGTVTVIAEARASIVERAKSVSPDLILLVPNHPDQLEVLSLLKSTAQTQKIKVVVIGPEGDTETRELALELGASGHVSKPISKDSVAKLLSFVRTQTDV